MSEELIRVDGLWKKMTRGTRRAMWNTSVTLGQELLGIRSTPQRMRAGEFWAVQDVSFSVRQGECLALLGQNGAGKSTLLKLLNGILRPDQGQVRMRGRIGALIEVGAGFHPMLTGRENVYVNGAILGMTRQEISRKFDSILDFSGLNPAALDQPVKTYSNGMYVRLGFSVAVHCEPDVLLIDEVLSVGDPGFIERSRERLQEMLKQGAAFLLVSHQMEQVEALCRRALLLEQGRVTREGTASELTSLFTRQCSAPVGQRA